MKRFALTIVIITLIFEILMFPKDAMTYAATGLTLWFDNMVPALFPFMVISSLVIRLDIAPCIVSFLHPLLKGIFRSNSYCEYAIVMGFLCGYPMGAVIIKDLLAEGKITTPQADYLLSFCNNIGPVFFATIVLPVFNKTLYPVLLFGMYGIPLLYGIFLRFFAYKNAFPVENTNVSYKQKLNDKNAENNFFAAFSAALNQAVSSSLFLGACMIFFNMLRFLPAKFLNTSLPAQTLISWLLETNGAIKCTGLLYQSNELIALLMLPLLSIGGLSCICQTAGILHTTPCNLPKHFLHKGIQAFLWLILMLLWHLFV